MSLLIELAPEAERRLSVAAGKEGMTPADLAASILEAELSRRSFSRRPVGPNASGHESERQRTPADLVNLARTQGVRRVARVEDLLGEGPADGDEFDPDEFILARKGWQTEGRLPVVPLSGPRDENL